jgi:hypothetical protein
VSESTGYSSNAVSVTVLENNSSTYIYNSLNLPSINYNGQFLKVCDGYLTDNTGIIALLRRKVKTIIFCKSNWDKPENLSCKIGSTYEDIAGLFGAVDSADEQKKNNYNSLRQVFYTKDWTKFEKQVSLHVGKNINKPLVFEMNLDVIQNDLCGVSGGYQVQIIFILSYINNGLLKDLSKFDKGQEIVNYIEKSNIYLDSNKKISWFQWVINSFSDIFSALNIKSAEFKYFPYIPITQLNYSKKLVNAMTHMGTYDVDTSIYNIKKWINNKHNGKL